MSDITVRRVKFEFPDTPDTLDDVFPGIDPVRESYLVAFSLTMPALEPYLIRTYRSVADKISDPVLAADVREFIGQEAQHFQNHRRVNDVILGRLGEPVAGELRRILDDLDRDYRRFNDTRSDRANLVYAEGFEAMTCAMAMTMFEEAAAGTASVGRSGAFGPWQQLWSWHAAEEIEHRTVAFGVYEHLVGSHPYRAFGSLRAQWHFQRCIDRLQRALLRSRGLPARPHRPPWCRGEGLRKYLRTFRRGYDPAALEPDPLTATVLAMFTSA
jgi:uncharacterized protein